MTDSIKIWEATREKVSAIEHEAFINSIDEGHYYVVFTHSIDGYAVDPLVAEVDAEDYTEAYILCEQAMEEYNTANFNEGVSVCKAEFIAGNNGNGECRVISDLSEIFLTDDEIKAAYEQGIIVVCEATEYGGCSGIVARIGDTEFYFDCENGEDFETAEEYVNEFGDEYVVAKLTEALNDMASDLAMEYACYRADIRCGLEGLEPQNKKKDDIER